MKNLLIIASVLLSVCACSHTVEEGVPDPTPPDTTGTPVDTDSMVVIKGDIWIQSEVYEDHPDIGQLVMVTDTLYSSFIGHYVYFKKYNLEQQSVYGDQENLDREYFLDYYKKYSKGS